MESELESRVASLSVDPTVELQSLLEDDQYQWLKERFVSSPAGENSEVPDTLQLNNKMLLQIFALKLKSNSSFVKAINWLETIFPHVSIPVAKFKHILKKAWGKALDYVEVHDLDGFRQFCNHQYDPDFVTDSLSAIGLGRRQLLQPETWVRPAYTPPITNGLIVDLDDFRISCKKGYSFVPDWICRISARFEDLNIIADLAENMLVMHDNIQDQIVIDSEKYEYFLQRRFFEHPAFRRYAVAECGTETEERAPVLKADASCQTEPCRSVFVLKDSVRQLMK